MKTFIVPVDFTEASVKVAHIAAQITALVGDARIILYNVFDKITAGIDGTPLTDDTDARKKITEMAFENVKAGMLAIQPSIQVDHAEEESSSLVASIEEFARQQHADLIMIGVGEGSGIEHFLMGSTALDIVKKNVCPVIIFPPNAQFKGVKNVLFASDYKDVQATTPIASIRSVLSMFTSVVHVIHVNSEDHSESDEWKKETAILREMLIEYMPEFHLINEPDFITAIEQLVEEKNIDLILTVPRTHTFFSNLFSAGHTRKLAYQSNVPVIAIHE